MIGGGFGNRRLGRRAVGDVAGDGDAVDVGRHLGGGFGVQVQQGNLGAGGGQHARGGGAEAGAPAGDERCVSTNIHDQLACAVGDCRTAGDNDIRRRRVGVKLVDQSGAMREHRPLIDRSFVGHFADVERGRFGKQNGAADAGGRAAARIATARRGSARMPSHPRVGQHRCAGRVRREIGGEFPAGIDVGNDQSGDFVAIRPGQHNVAHQRRALGNQRHAQRTDAHPGAGRKLEILGNAPVEQQAPGRIGGILEFERVADLVKSLVVKSGRSDRRRPPIAGRDIRRLSSAPRACLRSAPA